jgi:hypothetical protein
MNRHSSPPLIQGKLHAKNIGGLHGAVKPFTRRAFRMGAKYSALDALSRTEYTTILITFSG